MHSQLPRLVTTRRGVLQFGLLAGLGVSLPRALRAETTAQASPRDVNCILLWTRGGTSHHDTVDPKPEAPDAVRGPYGLIDTCVPGVQFTEVCPQLAANLQRFSVLRGWNPANGSHGTADQYVMSGRPFNPALIYPTYGSVVSYQLGFRGAIPPFVQLGNNIDRRFGGGSPGFLGSKHAAFELPADPNAADFSVRDLSLPPGVDGVRLARRQQTLARIEALQRSVEAAPDAFDSADANVQTAFEILTASTTQQAFALESETTELRDRYGRNRLGQSLLLSRRLIEAGVRFVTVTDGGWDTHQDNFSSLKDRLMPPVDQGLTALLEDLEVRGLLESTLVLWLTDFGRTPKINSASGRDHWSTAGFLIAAGAGVPGGGILGQTDREGGAVIRDEYRTEDLAATVYAKLGLPADLEAMTADGRPIRLVEGRLIREWM